MPIYEYDCQDCGERREEVRPMARREEPAVCACGGEAQVIFTPTPFVYTAAHFRLPRTWCLPAKEDTAGWEARCNSSQVHYTKPKPKETLKEHLTRELLGREKITLASGGSGA